MAVPIKLAVATSRIEEVWPSYSPPTLSTRASSAYLLPVWLSKSRRVPHTTNTPPPHATRPHSLPAQPSRAAAMKSGGAGSRSGPASCFAKTSRVLDGLSLYRLFLILAPGAYGEGERRDPDRYNEDEGHSGQAGREPDGTEERVRVDDEDKPADRGTHDTRRQYADDVGRNGGGDQTAEEQSRNDRPRHLRQAEADQEADARANGDHELAGIDGADDLARLHSS